MATCPACRKQYAFGTERCPDDGEALLPDEVIFTMHRNLGVFTARDMPLDRMFCQWQGKRLGYTKARDRSFHFGANQRFLADGPASRVVRGRIIDKDGGFTDYTTTITINNVCEDSLLATPLMLDLIILTELFERIWLMHCCCS